MTLNVADAVFGFARSGVHLYQERGTLCSTGQLLVSERDTIRRHKSAITGWLVHEAITLRHSSLGIDMMRKILDAYRRGEVSDIDYTQVSRAVDRSFERQDPEKIRRYSVDALRLVCPGSEVLVKY
jgi:hypothetical protein